MPKFIDSEIVRSLFEYSAATGVLTLKKSRGMGLRYKAGSSVGSLHECGTKRSKKHYLRTMINGSYIYVHRIIWVIMTREQPLDIDHIDGDGLNNKWENLRSVHHSVNGKNQKTHSTNTSGISGITYRKDSGKWRARITVDDKSISIGTYRDKQDAIQARKEAEIKYWMLDSS